MTTHDTRSQLLAEVAARPEDDTLRLAFADWLDEQPTARKACPLEFCLGGYWRHSGDPNTRPTRCHVCDGTGTVQDTADRDRAEFIRLDVERHRRWPDFTRVCEADRPTAYADWEDLTAIEKRILEVGTAHPEWSRCRCPWCDGIGFGGAGQGGHTSGARCVTCRGTGDLFLAPGVSGASMTPPPKPRAVTFARGFPDAVTCTLAEAFGTDGTPTPWAVEVVRQTPVVRFRMTDRTPERSIQHAGWFRWFTGVDHNEIPAALFRELRGEFPTDRDGVAKVAYWRTADAAIDALALAAGRLVRRHAYKERT